MDAFSTESRGVLYVVSTPIGNLEDATFRSIRILKEVALIASEDTRRTATLLRHYGIATPTRSYHAHNERQRTPSLIRALESGKSVALVSDAGTPLLSDPGRMLVAKALSRGISVTGVPGPSAVLNALISSGLTETEFTFLGFPPNRSQRRKTWLGTICNEPRPVVIFESPHRIVALLGDMKEVLGDREIAVCREMTKIHEEFVKGPISTVLPLVSSKKGEFSIVVSPKHTALIRSYNRINPTSLAREFVLMTENGKGRREAIRVLAKKYDAPSRQIYRILEEHKKNRSLDQC